MSTLLEILNLKGLPSLEEDIKDLFERESDALLFNMKRGRPYNTKVFMYFMIANHISKCPDSCISSDLKYRIYSMLLSKCVGTPVDFTFEEDSDGDVTIGQVYIAALDNTPIGTLDNNTLVPLE